MTANREKAVCFFGRSNFRDSRVKIGLSQASKARHLMTIGGSGVGKSRLLRLLMQQEHEYGFLCMDIHSDLVKQVYSDMDEDRKKDVTYLDLTDPNNKIGFNLLRKVPSEYRGLQVAGILEVFERLYDASAWGPRMSYLLKMVLRCLQMQPMEVNFADVLRVFRDRSFREKCVNNLADDSDVKSFFRLEFKQYDPRYSFTPIYKTIGGFLAHPSIQRLLVDNEDNLSLSRAMQERKIILCDFGLSRLGLDGTRLISSLFLTSVLNAGFARMAIPENERKYFTLYCDELGVYASDSVGQMWDMLRKVKITVIGAIQHLGQLSPILRESLFANVGNLVIFRCSALNAIQYFQHELFDYFKPFVPGDYVTLPNRAFICRLVCQGDVTKPFTGVTLPIGENLL